MDPNDILARVDTSPEPIQIHKFSAKTYWKDAIDRSEMSVDMARTIRETPALVDRVWRVKIGSQRRWHYGWSLIEAIDKALRGAGRGFQAVDRDYSAGAAKR